MKPLDDSEPATPGHDALALILSSRSSLEIVVAMTVRTASEMPDEWRDRLRFFLVYMHDHFKIAHPSKRHLYALPDDMKGSLATLLNEYLDKHLK